MAFLPPPVHDLALAVGEFDADQWRTVIATLVSIPTGAYRDARGAAKISAAQNVAAEKLILEAMLPRKFIFDTMKSGDFSACVATVHVAARALLKRDALRPDQFSLLVEPLRAAGVSVDTGAQP